MPTWPADLPQSALIEGYEEDEADNLLVTAMEVGPEKTRPRNTSKPYTIQWPLLLTVAQRASLKTFYKTTLAHGSLKYTHVHPVTGEAITCKISKPPKYVPASGTKFTTVLQVEVFP